MKRILSMTLFSMVLGFSAYGQSEIDALRMSRNDLTGTARSTAMGGAFGALGGDVGGIAINPAGIGVYKSSEIVSTVNFRNLKTSAELNNGPLDKNKFQFSFDNLAFVGAFPINDDVMPFLNFGFSYNKLKNFDRKYNMVGNNLRNSLTDYMAERANDSNGDLFGSTFKYDDYTDWLGGLAVESGLININSEGWYGSILGSNDKVSSDLWVREKGSINSYDFNIGTTLADIVSLGLSLSVTDIDYFMSSSYIEEFPNRDGFELVNELKTEGTGYQVKVGAIFKPVNELRIGLAYHSPTWYEMSDYFFGDVYNLDGYKDGETPFGRTDYDFKTPDKWVLSLAGVLGRFAIISLDYELTNYKSNMRFRNLSRTNGLNYQNDVINEDYRNASTLRIGAEYRFTPQIAGRIGYAWMQSPYNDNLTKNGESALLSGTIPHYVLEGDTHHITYGAGYRFTPNFYVDLAFIMKFQKDDLYNFSRYYITDSNSNSILQVDTEPGKLKNNLFSGLITLGYKF